MCHRGLSVNGVVFCFLVLGYSSRSAEVSVRTIQDAKPYTHRSVYGMHFAMNTILLGNEAFR
jgi:hypothetical protein